MSLDAEWVARAWSRHLLADHALAPPRRLHMLLAGHGISLVPEVAVRRKFSMLESGGLPRCLKAAGDQP